MKILIRLAQLTASSSQSEAIEALYTLGGKAQLAKKRAFNRYLLIVQNPPKGFQSLLCAYRAIALSLNELILRFAENTGYSPILSLLTVRTVLKRTLNAFLTVERVVLSIKARQKQTSIFIQRQVLRTAAFRYIQIRIFQVLGIVLKLNIRKLAS